ncbi:MAG: GNAT family N-acetyltransferase [Gemmatimonadetes bacterium]|nr:GNAT family N-acetyltransferase [Gemmatimonadota bacterium]
MSVRTRPATADEIPALQALIVRSARDLSVGYYTAEETAAAIRFVFGVDSQLVRDGSYIVAEVDGRLAGCGGWSKRRTLYGGDQRPVDGGAVAHAATARPTPDADAPAHAGSAADADLLDPAVDAARIRAFFVAPEAARQGVGRAILSACEGAAMDSGFTHFELMATLPGVPFYAAMGYVAAEPVVDVLPDGTPLRFVRMTRRP